MIHRAIGRGVRFLQAGRIHVLQRNFGAVFILLGGVEDPRCGNASLFDFDELLMIALCAVLCGGQGAGDRALFAEAKELFLRGFLKLEKGVPRRLRTGAEGKSGHLA